jgi:hypothetical protein
MSLTAEQQDNFEDIEKQFAVKGTQCLVKSAPTGNA